MDHSVVQKWLRSVLGPYANRDRVFADVDRALIAVSSLSPKTEVFTFNDGRTQLLLNLEGTIPVDFRNNTYNIPVAYWIPHDYPREPPMSFVAPTPDMAIRKGPNVDPSGEIGGDYLKRWRSKPEACNLLDLIHDCQQMFGREPPVYAKPKPTPVYATVASAQQRLQSTASTQASTSSPIPPRQAPLPLPASPSSSNNIRGPSFQSPIAHDPRQKPSPPAPGAGPSSFQDPSQAPHRPPKPSSSMGPEGYTPSPRNSMSHVDQYQTPPPLPPQGMHSPHQPNTSRFGDEAAYRRMSGHNWQAQQNATPPRGQYASPGPHPRDFSPAPAQHWQPNMHDSPARCSSQQYPQHPQQPQQQQQHRSQTYPYPASDHPSPAGYNGSSAPNPQQPQHAQHAPFPAQPAGQHSYQAPPQQVPPSAAPGTNGHRDSPAPPPIAAPKPKAVNLLDEDDSLAPNTNTSTPAAPSNAPAPPRPINPELLALHDRLFTKIDSRLSTLAATLSASNARLEVLSSDLDRGVPAIEDEMSRLKAVRDVCLTTGDRLQSSVTEISTALEALQQREDPDPDSMVLATSIVGNQLVDLVAEDNAIEDTLYQLGRALNAERIDLEKFMKQTRMLAREQFMKRALAMKISDGMGWS